MKTDNSDLNELFLAVLVEGLVALGCSVVSFGDIAAFDTGAFG